jgi:nitroreductase
METFEAIHARRAVKHYDPDHEMSEQEVRQLMELAIQTPTSFNIQNWRFVIVRDKQLRQQLRAAAFDQAQVTDASLVIILTADLMAWEKEPQRYWRNAPVGVRETLVAMLGGFYQGNAELQRDEAMRSTGLAGQTIMLAAKAMGYDSCPMVGFNAEKVAQLIHLPDDHVLSYMIVVGKATRPADPKPGQLPLAEVVIENRFAG